MYTSEFYPLMINGLIEVQDFVTSADIYQEGGCGNYGQFKPEDKQTFCNSSSFDVGEATGFHMEYVYGNKKRGDVTAAMAYANLKQASMDSNTGIVELPPLIAQLYANKGFTIFSLADDTSHMATVRPTQTLSIPDIFLKGPLLANVGPKTVTGIVSAKTAFGESRVNNNKVHYFMDVNQLQIYIGTTKAAKKY